MKKAVNLTDRFLISVVWLFIISVSSGIGLFLFKLIQNLLG